MSPTTTTDSTYLLGGRRRSPRSSEWPPAVMDATVARGIAHASHQQVLNRRGEPVIEHVARVAAAVPAEVRTVAWLHDVLERSPMTLEQLRRRGLSAIDSEGLALLTRTDDESYESHVLRIAHAHGASGRIARIVKLADLGDHLAQPWACGDPPYAWAHRHVANAATFMDTAPL